MAQDRKAEGRIGRRALLRDGAMLLGISVAIGAAARQEAAAQEKVSQQTAKYQNQPNNGQKCSACTYFQPPSSCKLVNGTISPNGWCMLFAAKSS